MPTFLDKLHIIFSHFYKLITNVYPKNERFYLSKKIRVIFNHIRFACSKPYITIISSTDMTPSPAFTFIFIYLTFQ